MSFQPETEAALASSLYYFRESVFTTLAASLDPYMFEQNLLTIVNIARIPADGDKTLTGDTAVDNAKFVVFGWSQC
jgi:hypothetical protein